MINIIRFDEDTKNIANTQYTVHELNDIHNECPELENNLLIEDGMITGIIVELEV